MLKSYSFNGMLGINVVRILALFNKHTQEMVSEHGRYKIYWLFKNHITSNTLAENRER
jgi:hypothetical protein